MSFHRVYVSNGEGLTQYGLQRKNPFKPDDGWREEAWCDGCGCWIVFPEIFSRQCLNEETGEIEHYCIYRCAADHSSSAVSRTPEQIADDEIWEIESR